MDWVAIVGVDWGSQEHAYSIESRTGGRRSGTLGSSAEQVHEWARSLKKWYPSGTVVVALEAGCNSLMYALTQYEYIAIAPINPRASKSYRDSLRLSGASDDPTDAALICEFALRHLGKLRIWQPEDGATLELRMLGEQRRSLVDQRTAATHTLSAALKGCFPQLLEWFPGETARPLHAFVERWPTLERARGASPDQIEQVFRACHVRKPAARAAALTDLIAASTPFVNDAAAVSVWARSAQAQVAIIKVLEAQIALYDQALDRAWQQHRDREIFDSLPGAGRVLAPRLAAAFGTDRDRFATSSEMQCYSGIAPVTEKSGKQCWIHARWAFPAFLHQTFHEFAQASISVSPWAKAVYQQQRQRGADRHEAIRALAFRWIRILFRLWKARETYNEQTHLERLRQHGSTLANSCAA